MRKVFRLGTVAMFLGLGLCVGVGLEASTAKSCKSVGGKWQMVAQIDKRKCGESKSAVLIVANIKQKGCNVSLTIPGVTLRGKVKGSTLHVTGSYNNFGKIRKWIWLTVRGNYIFGHERWTYQVKSLYKCAGTSRFAGFRK